jgi:hypothetical protein
VVTLNPVSLPKGCPLVPTSVRTQHSNVVDLNPVSLPKGCPLVPTSVPLQNSKK